MLIKLIENNKIVKSTKLFQWFFIFRILFISVFYFKKSIYLFTFSKWFISSFPQFKLYYVNILNQFMHISNLFVKYAYKYTTLFSFLFSPSHLTYRILSTHSQVYLLPV